MDIIASPFKSKSKPSASDKLSRVMKQRKWFILAQVFLSTRLSLLPPTKNERHVTLTRPSTEQTHLQD